MDNVPSNAFEFVMGNNKNKEIELEEKEEEKEEKKVDDSQFSILYKKPLGENNVDQDKKEIIKKREFMEY